MRFYLDGEMPPYLLAKDIILQVGRRVRDACQQGPAFHAGAACTKLIGQRPPRGVFVPIWMQAQGRLLFR